nr:MAG TPA: hypothetical protein [Caudoviricetes sp.]
MFSCWYNILIIHITLASLKIAPTICECYF